MVALLGAEAVLVAAREVLREIGDALVKVKPLIDVGNARIPPESVRKINDITTRLGSGIVTRD